MVPKPYTRAGLFMGVMSGIGFPDSLRSELEALFGRIGMVTEPFPFDFTDYYEKELGKTPERFFLYFQKPILPDELGRVKLMTNELELAYSDNGLRKIDLDPGYITEANVVLATTKARAHRVAIGNQLYAEVTLIYHRKGWETFPWTYPDYRSEKVQGVMTLFRSLYLSALKA